MVCKEEFDQIFTEGKSDIYSWDLSKLIDQQLGIAGPTRKDNNVEV